MPITSLFPADTDVIIGARVRSTHDPNPEWFLLPNLVEKRVREDGKIVKKVEKPRLEWLNSLSAADKIYAPLGGIDAILLGAHQRGASIRRVTFSDLNQYPYLGEIPVPDKLRKAGPRQAERAKHVAQMLEMVKYRETQVFRDYLVADVITSTIRELIGSIILIQDKIRKPLQLRILRLERNQEYLLPEGPDYPKDQMEVKVDFNKRFDPVDVLLKEEENLSKKIDNLLVKLDVWTEVLEPVAGMGPRLSARIIGPVADVRRFPTLSQFRKFCGWAVTSSKDGTYTVADKFLAGHQAHFHDVVRMGLWLFQDQILRQKKCQFKYHYYRYKLIHQDQLGQVMYEKHDPETKRMVEMTMTKKWLHNRARRYAASHFVDYLWWMWASLYGHKSYHSDTGELITQDDLLNPERYFGPLPASAVGKMEKEEEEIDAESAEE